jgi:hypothetical protein
MGGDTWSSDGRKRTWETELGDEPRSKVAATLSGEEVTSFNRDGGSTASIAQQQPQRAGGMYESLLPVGTSGDLQNHAIGGRHTSVEDTVQRHQVYAQPFQPTLPYSVMLQQLQQQRQLENFLSEATVAIASTPIQASQARMLQGLTSGRTSSQLSALSGLSHLLPRQQMHLPIAPEPNATQVSQALNLQALSGSEILQLLQHIQQPQQQGIASMASESERNLQQQHHLSASSVANAFTSTPVSQAQMLQALGGHSLLMQHLPSHQALFPAPPTTGSSNMQVLQFPVASASNVFTSYETSQAQIMEGLLQHFQSQQELSSTAAAAALVATSERNTPDQQMQDWQQKLALLAARENAIRASVISDQIAPTVQDDQQANTIPVVSAPPSLPTSSVITMWLPDDIHQLSEYQVTVRQNLEIFEAAQEDYESNIQGRKKKVIPGQAGIRCRHCSNMPLRLRRRGAVYYPLKLSRIYQAAQNMASSHLSDSCSQIPANVKQKLLELRHRRDTAIGGKKYWAEAGSASGLYETDEGLRLRLGNDGAAR